MTLDDLSLALYPLIPNHDFQLDNYGQLVIYTDMMLDGRNVVPFVEAE